jgi:hypothetical protein
MYVHSVLCWQVLLGHLMWVYMGVRILGKQHRPFFPPKGTWLRWRTDSNWVQLCVRACVRAYARACVRVRVCVCVCACVTGYPAVRLADRAPC